MRRRILVLFLIAGIALAGCKRGPQVDTQQVAAKYVSAPLPFEDPTSSLWQQATEHPAKLMVQDIAEPKLLEPGVTLVNVRALHNGDWVVFRLEWEDATQDLIPRPGKGSDAAAIQFPLAQAADVPSPAMGERGKGVRIWYWKSLWQDDDERRAAGKGDRIATLYPNAAPDHYPFQANPSAREEMEKRYAPARAAGNPILARSNAGPVQVLMAEGFGNTTPTPAQTARGHGVWKDGKWMTTIARPLRPGAELGDLEVGKRGYVAFAIWDGDKQHTGSRKMRSGWIPFKLVEK
ncbi:MAG TPA: ethylbenzene dehydrogenase-related protein [Terriglobales bacterium]|nr:ethylbenzene dehydrogenase-related protein [Terriglobales bacterium]